MPFFVENRHIIFILCVMKRIIKDDLIGRIRSVHGTKYDCSRIEYVNNKTPIELGCPDHGTFMVRIDMCLHRNRGCPKCGRAESIRKRSLSNDTFVERARAVHGERYDYSRSRYVNASTKVEIIDTHTQEVFWQTPINHLAGHGSVRRRNDEFSNRYRSSKDQFVSKATGVHGNRYDYSGVDYVNASTKVDIVCAKHGAFQQRPGDHVNLKQGCPSCQSYISRPQQNIHDWLVSIGKNPIMCYRKDGIEIDILIDQIGIEYCGLYWHSELAGKRNLRYHQDKYDWSAKQGIRLLTIFSDEWETRTEVIKKVIVTALGDSERGPGGRKLRIDRIDTRVGQKFCDQHHVQGRTSSVQYAYGGFDEDRLCGVMLFGHPSRQNSAQYELKRFCTDDRTYPGLAGRLFAKFCRDVNPSEIVSFSDNRWFSGGMYERLGFVRSLVLRPDYSYTKDYRVREHKTNYRKSILAERFGETEGTEWEIMQRLGYDRVWDCGKVRWLWTGK